MYFWTYGLPKTCLDKGIKSPVSEDSLTSNMVNRVKNSWNVNGDTVPVYIDYYEGNWGGKNLS